MLGCWQLKVTGPGPSAVSHHTCPRRPSSTHAAENQASHNRGTNLTTVHEGSSSEPPKSTCKSLPAAEPATAHTTSIRTAPSLTRDVAEASEATWYSIKSKSTRFLSHTRPTHPSFPRPEPILVYPFVSCHMLPVLAAAQGEECPYVRHILQSFEQGNEM